MAIESTQKCLLFGSYFFVIGNKSLQSTYFSVMSKYGFYAIYFKYRLILTLINSFDINAYNDRLAIVIDIDI